jgi:hypothetical protein
MTEEYLDFIRDVLDHELVDVNNVPCGMVDNIETQGEPGKELTVTAILVGVGAWSDRLPAIFGWAARKIFGSQKTRVPWDEVLLITERVKLKSRASELGLGKADRRAAKWIAMLPKASE